MKKIFSIFMITFLLAGCSEDFLDRTSLTSLASDNFWTTEDDALMALAGCYDSMQSNNLFDSDPWGGGIQRLDYISDDGYTGWNWMQGGKIASGTHNATSGMIRNFWSAAYRVIGRCNRVIEAVPTLGVDILPDESAKQIVAEAKFIRALVYNHLVMTYEDVPLVTIVQSVEDAAIAKSSKADIVNFMITDLEGSVEDLAFPGTTEWGRATKGAGYALLARINLYNENWSSAATWSQKVIDLGYSLFDDFEWLFQAENEMNNEVIFSVRFIRGPDGSGANFAGHWGYLNYQRALPNLGETFFCIDGKPITESPLYDSERPFENRDPRFDGTLVSKNSYWWREPSGIAKWNSIKKTGYLQKKYVESDNYENHFDADEDFYMFRLGEVLLMKAEAIAEGAPGGPQEVFDLINQLRDRVGVQMPHVNQAEVDTYYGGSIIEMVRHERRVETAFEGLRYFDLKRWGILKERAYDYFNEYEFNQYGLKSRVWQDKFYKWPIPQPEIDVNDLLEQHDSWR